MVVLEALAAVGLGARDLFMYNRKGFMFNILQEQEAAYKIQENRLVQTLLCREDARDLFTLSLKRMHLYALVSTVLLLIALGLVSHGELPRTTPSWLFYAWIVSTISAAMYLFVATWFSVLASVNAQILLTRMRTQWLRLPVPSVSEVDALAVPVESFEKEKGSKSLRFPVLSDQTTTKQLKSSPVSSDLVGFTDHFLLYQEIITLFQGYECYGRIALVFGVSQLANALSYIALIISPVSVSIGVLAFVGFSVSINIANLRLNLLVAKSTFAFLSCIVMLAPLSACLSSGTSVDVFIAPVTMTAELLSLALLTGFAMKCERGLPLLFSSVIQLDLLGTIKKKVGEVGAASAIPTASVVSRSLDRTAHELKEGESILTREDGDLVKQHLTKHIKEHRKLSDDVYLVDDDVSQAGSFFFISYVCLFLWLMGIIVSIADVSRSNFSLLGYAN